MTLFIYPVVACWVWNPTGWLFVNGFHDFAGCSVVHVVGGASGLIGTIIAGPRYSRFDKPWLPFLCRQRRQEKFEQEKKEQFEQVNTLSKSRRSKNWLMKESSQTKTSVISALMRLTSSRNLTSIRMSSAQCG
jgi:ammonia channel protein AmtB